MSEKEPKPLKSSEDLDPVVVERALFGGYDGRTTIAERREIVRRAHAMGWSDKDIMRKTRTMTDRAAIRIRKLLDLPAIEQYTVSGNRNKRWS